jgi:murein DD-endopeptidase MepM/ murein hydrolase activator NlpD
LRNLTGITAIRGTAVIKWRFSLRRALRAIAILLAPAFMLLPVVSVHAERALPPGEKPGQYVRWFYPAQLPYGMVETGTASTGGVASGGAFLTLPFMGPHIVTSGFDHCYPDYGTNGRICRYDGTVASATLGGPDPSFPEGYAQTPGGQDYLYYDGHDGYDYALTYEPVAAAADGTVMWADWLDPNCHTCLSGLTIEINHGNGLLSFYGHLSQIGVTKGQRVRRGQVIGRSGMTGTATGPHLHFGIYYVNRSQTPVDPYGWTGSSPDPWTWDLGNLWISGSPRFAPVPQPKVEVSAVPDLADPSAITVSWSSPGDGDVFHVAVVQQDGTMKDWLGPVGPGSAVFHGGESQRYWFWVSVTTNLGWTDANASPAVQIPGVDHGSAG